MADGNGTQVFTDAAWAVWEPLVEEVRPRGKTPPDELRRTISAVFWRHRNGATWRAIPAELGPWWLAAQLFIRWARRCVWERLLELAQERMGGAELGMAFLDGTNIRAHAIAKRSVSEGAVGKANRGAAGAPKKGGLARAETSARRLAALAAATAPRPSSRRTRAAGP